MTKTFKRAAAAVLALTVMCGSTPVMPGSQSLLKTSFVADAAENEITSGGITYTLYENNSSSGFIKKTAIVKECKLGGTVTIPSQVNGYTVVGIGPRSFQGNTDVTEVVLPDTIDRLYSQAFYLCENLTSINIPAKVEAISKDALSLCDSLKSIKLDSNNKKYSLIDSVLYELDDSNQPYMLMQCPAKCGKGSVNIPSTVKIINNRAFKECTTLVSVSMPDSIETINGSAFEGCSKLVSVSFSESLTEFPAYCFRGCTSLKSITIPDHIQKIGTGCFWTCSGLENITIENAHCDIDTSAYTISSKATINGYTGSTADVYAQANNRTFKSLGSTYKVSLKVSDYTKGDVSNGGLVGTGHSTNITAIPNAGYVFDYWLDSNGKKYTSNPLKISQAGTYTAYFKPGKYNINVEYRLSGNYDDGDKCTVTGGGIHDGNSTVTLKAVPSEHATFQYWEVDSKINPDRPDIIWDNPYTFTATEDMHIVAFYAYNSYKLKAEEDEGCWIVKGLNSRTSPYNTELTYEAEAKPGYVFKGWYDDKGNLLCSDPVYTFRLKENTNLIATSEKQSGGGIKKSLIRMNKELTVDIYAELGDDVSIAYIESEDGVAAITDLADQKITEGENAGLYRLSYVTKPEHSDSPITLRLVDKDGNFLAVKSYDDDVKEGTNSATINVDDYVKEHYSGEDAKAPWLGDPMCDNIFTADDASYALRLFTKLSGGAETATAFEMSACDVNGNGVLSADDASLILRYYTKVSSGQSIDKYEYFKNPT